MAIPDDENRIEPSDEFRRDLARLLNGYLVLQDALASDDAKAAVVAVNDVKTILGSVVPRDDQVQEYWEHPKNKLNVALADIPIEIEKQREVFEKLSNAFIQIVELFGNPLDVPIRVAHCPMAFGNKGANWIQKRKEIRNAYFGSEMLACGSIERNVAPSNSPKMEPSGQPESQ